MEIPIEVVVAGFGAVGVVISMQFKINRCVGRLEGLLHAHLDKK